MAMIAIRWEYSAELVSFQNPPPGIGIPGGGFRRPSPGPVVPGPGEHSLLTVLHTATSNHPVQPSSWLTDPHHRVLYEGPTFDSIYLLVGIDIVGT